MGDGGSRHRAVPNGLPGRPGVSPGRPSGLPGQHGPLQDRFGRIHRSLRISVTDACNIRCQYCMPADGVTFLARDRHLGFGHIGRFVEVMASSGLERLRLTGGEPLLRPGLDRLVARLAAIPAVREVALTTNGMLLADRMADLARAGLRRVNISLDTLSEETFRKLSRREGLDRVLRGIDAVLACPTVGLRLNALILRDVNLGDVLGLVGFARERRITLRFIEFMPLDANRDWSRDRMVSGDELRQIIAERYGGLRPADVTDASQPARDYLLPGGGRVGFIDTVTRPFCGACDRLRLTSDGKLRNCLFGQEEWDVGRLLRRGGDAAEIERTVRDCLAAKHPRHGIAEAGFRPPPRAMYQIGG